MKKEMRIILLIIVGLVLVQSVFASQLRVTQEHPFLINKKWIKANELNIGDKLTTLNNQKVIITSIKDIFLEKPIQVYNLEAEVLQNFIVEKGVVVHNSNFEKNICSRCNLKAEIRPFEELLSESVNLREIDIRSSAAINYREKLKKSRNGETLNSFEKESMIQYGQNILDLQNVKYRLDSGNLILLPEGPVGEIVKKFNEKGYEVIIDPLYTFPQVAYEKRVVFLSLDSFFHKAIFRAHSKHEWGHLLKVKAFTECENLDSELLSDMIFFRPTKKTTPYNTFQSDEFNQYSRSIYEIADEGLREPPYYMHIGLLAQTEILKLFVKEGEAAASYLKSTLKSLTKQKLSMLSLTFEREPKTNIEHGFLIDEGGSKEYDIGIIFGIDNNFGREVLEIQSWYFIDGFDGRSYMYITDSKSIDIAKKIIQEHKTSRKAKEQLVSIIREHLLPQSEYLDSKVKRANQVVRTLPVLLERLQKSTNPSEGKRVICNILELLEKSIEKPIEEL